MASTSQSQQRLNDAEKESRHRIDDVVEAYDAVIQGNSILDQKYRAEEAVLLKKLHEIQAELREYKQTRDVKTEPEKQDFFRYYSVGKPYFKDKNLNPPPDNEDTIIMKQYQMYDFSNVMTVSGWTVGDKTRLLSVLLDLSKEIIRKNIYLELAQLQRAKVINKAVNNKIANLKHELLALKHKTLDDLDLCGDQEFDWEEVAMKLNKRHSSVEYKAIWDLFFHPRVNKSPWSHEEHQELQRIALEKKMQDWESIAKALNTGRTGYQCFVYFRTNVNHAACGRKWTQAEMNYLQRVINLYKEENYIPWGKVAASIENRTKIQCYNKYMRMIEGRKGRFLPEEDAVILNFVNVYGTDYRKMSSFLTGRSGIQLRVRYNLLLKLRVSTTWSIDDDKKLLQIMANQDSRTNFSLATKHFPGKDRQNIRSRYNTLIKWMKSHPHSDISTAPRRGARRLAHGEPTSNLVKAIENLRNRMQQELERDHKQKMAKKKLTRESSHITLHDSIMSTISAIEMKQHLEPLAVNKLQKAKVEDSFQILKLRDISTTPQEQSNLFNIKHILIILNAHIADKQKFYNSAVGKGFEQIENTKPTEDEPQVKIKSYSKRETATDDPVIKPTLFGNIAGRRKFLFPPNFASVTGSRVILTHLNASFTGERSDINLKQLTRKNAIVRKYLTQLRERFIDIFTWAYVLSNESPEYYKLYAKKNRAQAKPFTQKALPCSPSVTIPPPPPKRFRKKYTEEDGIDAMEVDDHNVIDIEKIFPDNVLFEENML